MDERLQEAYDVVVVGGGAAGLAGALALARFRRTVLVVDAGAPRNAPAAHMHNYLGLDGASPLELLDRGRAEVRSYGCQVVAGTVRAVTAAGDGRPAGQDAPAVPAFRVELEDGRAVRTRRVLVAVGLRDQLPDVPGLAARWGRDVVHCPYCHGWEVRDQAVVVLGSGVMSQHQALMFRQLTGDVVFLQHDAPALSDEQRAELAAWRIPVVDDRATSLDVEDDRLAGVRLASGDVLRAETVVVAPRATVDAGPLAPLGLEPVDQEVGGHVVGRVLAVDPMGATSVPGVFVAGNAVNVSAQVIGSAAGGLMAGAALNNDLIAEDTQRALATRTPEPVTATT